MPLRAAGVCGFLALVTSTLGWVVGGLAQPGAYSAADDDVSDLGALTASSAWIYNQIGANLTGLLVMTLALGLWRAPCLSLGSASSSTGSSGSTARGSTAGA